MLYSKDGKNYKSNLTFACLSFTSRLRLHGCIVRIAKISNVYIIMSLTIRLKLHSLDINHNEITVKFGIQYNLSENPWDVHQMLFQCWTNGADGVPALKQHWVNVSCLHCNVVFRRNDERREIKESILGMVNKDVINLICYIRLELL